MPRIVHPFVNEETGAPNGRSLAVSAETWRGETLVRVSLSDPGSVEWGGTGYLRADDARALGMRMVLDAEAAGTHGPMGRQEASSTTDRGWVWRVRLRLGSDARVTAEGIVHGDGELAGPARIAEQIAFWGGAVSPERVLAVLLDLAAIPRLP